MQQLSIVDYIVLVVFLAVSLTIGGYYACTGGKQRTIAEYLLGNRRMGMLPISISIFVSFQSAIMITGVPAEIYLYGVAYLVAVVGTAVAPLVGVMTFVPFFYRLQLVSVFEYLEMRFQHRAARLLGSGLSLLYSTLYMGVCLYAPALSLSAVSAMPVWASILIVGGVGTGYTTIGGIKAVVWTAVFQSGIMIAGVLAVAIQGTIEVGGWSEVWDISRRGRRLDFNDFFSFDPTVRMTLWSSIVGISIQWTYMYCLSQASAQRYCSTRSLRTAVGAMLINIPLMLILLYLVSYCGFVLFANYAGCDPKLTGQIKNHNQLMPHFVVNSFGFLQGMPGLFVACLFSSALNTFSSGLNSMSTNLLEDFLMMAPCVRQQPEKCHVVITKLIAVTIGGISIGLAFLMQFIPGPIQQISLSIGSVTGSASLGLFLLGTVVPFGNWKGALAGCFGGLCLTGWLVFGSMAHKVVSPILPLSTAECAILNATQVTFTEAMMTSASQFNVSASQPLSPTGIMKFYNVSYLWFALFGTCITLLIGTVVSSVTGGFDHRSVSSQLFFQTGNLLPHRLVKPRQWGNDTLPNKLRPGKPAGEREIDPVELAALNSTENPNADE